MGVEGLGWGSGVRGCVYAIYIKGSTYTYTPLAQPDFYFVLFHITRRLALLFPTVF